MGFCYMRSFEVSDGTEICVLWTLSRLGALHSAPTSLRPSERLTAPFFISHVCRPHRASKSVRRSICESNVQKQKVAAAAAPEESACSLPQPHSQGLHIKPRDVETEDEKKWDNAEGGEWRGGTFLTWAHRVLKKHGCQRCQGDSICFFRRGCFCLISDSYNGTEWGPERCYVRAPGFIRTFIFTLVRRSGS